MSLSLSLRVHLASFGLGGAGGAWVFLGGQRRAQKRKGRKKEFAVRQKHAQLAATIALHFRAALELEFGSFLAHFRHIFGSFWALFGLVLRRK